MVSRFLTALSTGFFRIGALLRRPETFVFLPALTLAAFWLGGERDLILMALGAPLLFAISGAVQPLEGTPDQPQVLEGLSLRAQIVGTLDNTLRESHISGRTTACLVLQFDLAERIVEQHGRTAQTEVLARSAERICASLRSGDVVARLEGGGFAVALAPVRRLDLETVVQVAARLQSALSAPISLNATRIYTTCSIGFCLGTRAPEATGASLLNAAQIAADDALRHGPGAIRSYSADMAATRADRDALREELEIALDEGQIRPHFQPQISTHTGAITGFEALARWYHPDKGLIPPAEFLPMIEDAGLSERLGEVILYHALSALARWDRAGLNVPTVAVNFSSPELRNPRLAEKLKWELDRFDLQPNRLTIEVLENVVAQTDNDIIVSNIAALAALGCGIDLDDFGTGHASITSIRRFAVRRIKIDRSFVTRLDEDREQQKMVAAILSMAERLGLETLAEGVETPGEHAMLSQLGCGDVQGFGIARPMPVDETMEWIARHRAKVGAIPRIGSRAR
ncbi:MAG: bifunctional diguanylate cyclase/phosphodiesterase [Cypionkella sp.]|uniref:putative bifunctional diguanylate cyclase/phosphodiesterase n=1 Tax=Cypionkella sp. TaxID=2811411 RepID=UPI002AB91AF0|nr:bifunctional diguanylate cyclase/phosphodiesterase [Cypionkella sp.]MDZ4309272.1 bifunctional diguanylate cyclase/phosphodiesterase [Cypionkella sp.]MDZ4393292.1 bifunctional diguanylate cyclase/phosphodiesterase [Cypionkella sp.]